MDREIQLQEIQKARDDKMDNIQNTRREQIQQLATKREQCEEKNDEDTCRAGWDVKIDEKRAFYEEQMEIVREQRDTDMEQTRVAMEDSLTNIRTT